MIPQNILPPHKCKFLSQHRVLTTTRTFKIRDVTCVPYVMDESQVGQYNISVSNLNNHIPAMVATTRFVVQDGRDWFSRPLAFIPVESKNL